MGSAAVGVATTVVTTAVLIWVLERVPIIDTPNQRSSHTAPTLRGGGIAVLIGCVVGLSLAPSGLDGRFSLGLVVVSVCFGAIGLIDDVSRGVGVAIRFGMQVAVALLSLVFLLDGLTGHALWKIAFGAGVALWLVTFVNGFNFMDGINGISSLEAIATGSTLALLGVHADVDVLKYGGLIVAAASVGFLPFNFPRARIFLGDVGSYSIGAWLAVLAAIGLRAGLPPEAVMAPFAVYLADTGSTLVRRLARRERWHEAHREHTYQRLVDSGWAQPMAAIVVFGCVLGCSALGAMSLADSAPARVLGDVGAVAVTGFYLMLPRLTRRTAASSQQAIVR
jgi:UDP-N-acetylmuramyl pentapeptide phosphotransferase/UDP-N-acetylglucosamine-1-phosphate transferase